MMLEWVDAAVVIVVQIANTVSTHYSFGISMHVPCTLINKSGGHFNLPIFRMNVFLSFFVKDGEIKRTITVRRHDKTHISNKCVGLLLHNVYIFRFFCVVDGDPLLPFAGGYTTVFIGLHVHVQYIYSFWTMIFELWHTFYHLLFSHFVFFYFQVMCALVRHHTNQTRVRNAYKCSNNRL